MLLEFSQMMIRSDEDFKERLDQEAAEHSKNYLEQIAKAALEHERVREGAERERQRLILEQELQRRKREEEQKQELERIEREKAKVEAEARQRQVEAQQRAEEAARKAAQQQRLIKEAEERLKAENERKEAERQQKLQQEEAARKAQEAAAAAAAAEKARSQAAQQAPRPTLQPPQPTQASATPTPAAKPSGQQLTSTTNVEELHTKYLELHQRMKQFWKPFKKESAQKGNPLKGPVGDLRRDMRKATGQVTVKRDDSRVVITKLRAMLGMARDAGGPTIDIRPFIVSHPIPQLANEAEAQYPAILLYAFICFEKFMLKQFESEAPNEEGRIIQELGAIAASLFVDKNFTWKDIPMTDLLLAKLHRICPILFGIRGPENTERGLARLGRIKDCRADINIYNQRMIGLGAGYAALSLRAVLKPAIPMSEYWRAVSSICNVPSQELTRGHFMVLKGLVKDSPHKIIAYYGAQGTALLRRATVVLPQRAPAAAKEEASLVSVLPGLWKIPGIA
jgi:nucleoporin GLE1